MMKDLIIANDLECIGKGDVSLHLAHVLCHDGECLIRFNDKDFNIRKFDCCIIRATQLIESVQVSSDFKASVIYASPQFIEKATPNTNYGMRGSISLSQNPVMSLSEEEYYRCKQDFDDVSKRLAADTHNFYEEMLLSVVRTLILDFFDIHVRIHGLNHEPTSQSAYIMGKFIGMLERGYYRKNREVGFYASELCITPKNLSEISIRITGFTASWWINRFTILDITRQLRDKSQTLQEISETFNFTSLSYFSRYVHRHLGESPTDFRR